MNIEAQSLELAAKFYLPTHGELLIDGREIRAITSHSLNGTAPDYSSLDTTAITVPTATRPTMMLNEVPDSLWFIPSVRAR